MLKCPFIAFVFAFIVCTSHAQNLDSLYAVWQDETQADSSRAAAYNDYIWDGYLFSKPDTVAVLAEAMHRFAQEHRYPKASATAYTLQGIANHIQGNYALALEYYHKSLAIEEEMGNKKGIASNLGNIGIIYMNQGDYPRALEYYERALILEEEVGHKEGVAGSLNNIGAIYADQGNHSSALEYYERALAINEETGNKQYLANILSRIGSIFSSQGDYPRALEYLKKAEAIRKEIGDAHGSAASLGDIGLIYYNQGNYPSALEYHMKAWTIRKEIGDNQGIAASLNGVGNVYKSQGNYSLALEYCQKSLDRAEEIGVLEIQKSACQCLFNTYKSMGNSRKALDYFEQMIVIRDSIYNEENTKKLTRIQMQYEFERKEAATKAEQEKKDAIALQELQRHVMVRNGFMGGFVVVVLFACVSLVQRNRISKEKKRSEELLLNILPEETAKELKEKGHSDAQLIEHATVLFTDFKGFTAMSEQLSPKELVKDLHECFSAFDRICEKHGIEKIKTIGDAYMAAGGLPTPNSTHAQDAVNAALDMASFVEEGKMRKHTAGLPFFEIRIGVHTGPVVAGIVGVKKFQYDIWGDTVNTAARMESSSTVGKVNISKCTYVLIKNNPVFSFESRGEIEAKGKGGVEMYFVSRNNIKQSRRN